MRAYRGAKIHIGVVFDVPKTSQAAPTKLLAPPPCLVDVGPIRTAMESMTTKNWKAKRDKVLAMLSAAGVK